MTQYRQVPTKAQRLHAEAAEAAAVRDALTHPDVVALRVEKLRTVVDRFIWTGMILGLLFTMTNVQQFTAHTTGATPGTLGWGAAWLLDPTVSVILLGVLLAERETSRWSLPDRWRSWSQVAKWSLLAATYVMNTWESYVAGNLAGIVLHSVPPLAVFVGAEAVSDCQDKLTECVHRAHDAAVKRAAERAKAKQEMAAAADLAADTERDSRVKDAETQARIEVIRSEAGVQVATNAGLAAAARNGPVVFGQPGSDRSGATSQTGLNGRPGPSLGGVPDRLGPITRTGLSVVPDGTAGPVQNAPTDRSTQASQTGPAKRSGTVRKPATGRPGKKPSPRQRTDDDLLKDVRELVTENDGEPPTKYQLKQTLGIGNERAARLLEQLDPQPAGAPASNGAATAGDRS